ncbi:MAG: GtrA family protein [Candidatus Nealsonbacteria bacterium]|nr:GtrA family protein [Candidatus Nealsonbacteria bacterium]
MKSHNHSSPIIQQFFRYVIIGLINTGLDFGIYTALTRGFEFWKKHYLWANAIAFLIVVTWSFFWNKYWTFNNHERKHLAQYMKFVFTTLIGISIAEGVLYMGVEIFSLHDLVSKIIAAPFVVFWNFFNYRIWVFHSQ